MKIIQSFAQFDEGSPYLQSQNKPDYVYLSFYCFLLSQITIKKLYGNFTMFCNRQAYDSMLKYIPYPAFEFMENNNNIRMWSKYKIDVMKSIGDDFIHIDPDVSLFKNVLDPFINQECDVMVQDVVPFHDNKLRNFVFHNIEYFAKTNILTKPFDGNGMSCGTLGINKYAQEYYFKGIDVLYQSMLDFGLENIDYPTLILEEQLLYLLSVENDFIVHEILPRELVSKEGLLAAGDKFGYLHIWRKFKYRRGYINSIRKKIYFDYPNQYEIILKYEHEILSKFKFFQHMNFPKIYDL